MTPQTSQETHRDTRGDTKHGRPLTTSNVIANTTQVHYRGTAPAAAAQGHLGHRTQVTVTATLTPVTGMEGTRTELEGIKSRTSRAARLPQGCSDRSRRDSGLGTGDTGRSPRPRVPSGKGSAGHVAGSRLGAHSGRRQAVEAGEEAPWRGAARTAQRRPHLARG